MSEELESKSEQIESRKLYRFLDPEFLGLMNEIGKYGHDKYGSLSFHARAEQGDRSRGDHPRTAPQAIAEHAKEHFAMYLRGELHDKFGTRKHQLAAVAFNAMMEYYFAGEEQPQASGHSTR